jgi:DNA-binding response OmpR family regulator
MLGLMRVLLIEDDARIGRELVMRWHARDWQVHVCPTLGQADEALGQADAASFDLIVLDLGLPDGDGLAWLRLRRKRDRHTPLLVLTARDSISDRVEGLKGGADDYLVKPFAPEELDARIEVVTRRAQRDRGEVLQFGALTWMRDDRSAFVDGRALDLLPREFELLGLLMRRAPQLVHKSVLADGLAERNPELGEAAVDVYVSRLRRKLEFAGVVIQTARGFGFRLVLVPPEKA